ncbi:1103_t:CDS:2 [Gigaspora rosea]|nr:1103_t:CDS:2 [Gigaspora rosea]
MTYDLLNMYLDDNENCKYAIDEKYYNRPNDVEHSSRLIMRDSETIVNVSWKKDIDNSIRLLMFWSNLVSIILNSYLRQVCGQSNKADVRVKGIEGDIRTLDIDGVRREQKAVCNEMLKSKRVDNSMMKHQIDIMMNTNFDNIRLKATEYYKIDEMDTWEVLHQHSYASLDHDQEVGVINRNFIGNINYDRCIINGKGFERNHKPNRGDVNFDNKVHGV